MIFVNKNAPLLRAFQNLTMEARIIQIFRFFNTIVTFVVILVSLLGPFFSIKFYIARINCSHLDVSKGIYESLRNSVSQPSDSNDKINGQLPIDDSLTNSEISILSEYAEEQVANSPQYYLVSLWEACTGDYNITLENNKKGQPEYIKHDDTITCKKSPGLKTVFNYRMALREHNMESVLAYADKGSYDDSSYSKEVEERNKSYSVVPITLTIGAILSGGLLLFQYVLYSNKGDAKDLSNLPTFLLHIVTIVTVMNFLAIAIATGVATSLLLKTRKEVKNSFGSFGINLQLGRIWFLLTWIGFSTSLVLMTSWILPIWCSNHPDDEAYFEGYSYLRTGDFKNMGKGFKNQIKRQQSERSQRSQRSNSNDSEDLESSISYESRPQDKILYETSSEDESSENSDYDNYGNDKFFNYKDKEQSKLRKLGESLSRKSSVRQLNTKLSRNKTTTTLRSLKEHELTAQEALKVVHEQSYSPLPHHYRVDTFDGFQETTRKRHGDYNPFEEDIEMKDLTK